MTTQSQNGVVSLSIRPMSIARANLGKMGCSTPTQNNPTPLQVP